MAPLHISTKVFFLWGFISLNCQAQEVPISSYSLGEDGRAQIGVLAAAENYYVLRARHNSSSDFPYLCSFTLGTDGILYLQEPLVALGQSDYRVEAYPIATPADVDGDGIDDMTEYQSMPDMNPLNAAETILPEDGSVILTSQAHFRSMSEDGPFEGAGDILDGREFLKFVIFHFDTDSAKTYFINKNTHDFHADFFQSQPHLEESTIYSSVTGDIIYHPTLTAPSGAIGLYTINYSWGVIEDFETIAKAQELVAASMPFLENDLAYLVLTEATEDYEEQIESFNASRVSIVLESLMLAGMDYIPLNLGEGYGYFRSMSLGETPGSRDVVLYNTLPNTLPRVGGILTSVPQTPLSHVNLRAIQSGFPNAFIRDASSIEAIDDLLGDYVHYRVDADAYVLESASIEEVNNWYASIRPVEPQYPPLDLEEQHIRPLAEIDFDMADAYGAKCANLATMREFGFPEGTIPDGFGVPFYFYHEFMEHNGLFEYAEGMMAESDFQQSREIREWLLENLRTLIEEAAMPTHLMDELGELQLSFPLGASIRCRSSTNNEDLPGFSGAGLYSSKTHHEDEGHLSKTIKEIFASMWNLRAFDEREFYRIDHFRASMGVLCHLNFENELANGVAVSADPIYLTDHHFYLNTQVGEALVTNPGEDQIPEEILLGDETTEVGSYSVLRYSSLVEDNHLVMGEGHMAELRAYLSVIHDEFAWRYGAENDPNFAMDIEYKVTSDDVLSIKQARPWVSFWSNAAEENNGQDDSSSLVIYPNPSAAGIHIRCDCEIERLEVFDRLGRKLIKWDEVEHLDGEVVLDVSFMASGTYILVAKDGYGATSFVEHVVIE